jgi:CII-binding regulator of phage lambda lysogenization HflD
MYASSQGISYECKHKILAVNFDGIKTCVLWNGNECRKNKVMRFSRQLFPVKIMIGQKQLEDV